MTYHTDDQRRRMESTLCCDLLGFEILDALVQANLPLTEIGEDKLNQLFMVNGTLAGRGNPYRAPYTTAG